MLPFITGSREYGVAKADSDLDLVIRVTESTLDKLISSADKVQSTEYNPDTSRRTASLTFGKLNIIAVCDDISWSVWRLGTDKLKKEETAGMIITREHAVATFSALRQQFIPALTLETVDDSKII